ncbi:MAG: hypothetical protein ACLPND_13205 [Candidatus Korobacteraceae bacterium]
MKLLRMLGFAALVLCVAFGAASAQTWTPANNVPNISAGPILLLTDGSVLVQDSSGNYGNWWKLTPSINGDYVNGSWTQLASLPSTYGPLYFGSAVLPDGRVIIEGGEYNYGSAGGSEVKLGAIYDPIANAWTSVNPPSGWNTIGDGASVILTNGTYMQGSCCDNPPHAALLNAKTLTWTATGSGKFDPYVEEGLTLLPGGMVLDVDAYYEHYDPTGMNYELYNPGSGTWSVAGSTPVQLWDSSANCGGAGKASYELGPAVLRPDGTVYATGANRCAAGHTAVYNVSAGTWTAGPDFPGNLDIADGPAALLPDGNVLMMTGPGIFGPGAVFFEWDGSKLNQVPGVPNSPSDPSFVGHMLVLPTGQVLFTDFSNDVEIYTSPGSPYPGLAPSALLQTAVLARGSSFTLFGFKFNGASQASAYGDDFQDATNYPIVRITNKATGHVFYCRTHDHNTMAVGYNGPAYTHLDIPANMETGASYLEVVANGIASQKYQIGIE